jgi:hypothetical protein
MGDNNWRLINLQNPYYIGSFICHLKANILPYFYNARLFNLNAKILYFDILWIDQSSNIVIVTHHPSVFPIVNVALISDNHKTIRKMAFCPNFPSHVHLLPLLLLSSLSSFNLKFHSPIFFWMPYIKVPHLNNRLSLNQKACVWKYGHVKKFKEIAVYENL